MSRLARELRAPGVASLLSVAAHLALSLLLGAALAAEHGGHSVQAQRGLARLVPQDLGLVRVQVLAADGAFVAAPGRREGTLELPQASSWARPTGVTGQTVPHPDSLRAGRGGERQASVRAVNLADQDDGLSQTVVTRSHVELDQVHRRRAGQGRSSREDARLLARPMELELIGGGGTAVRELSSSATFDRAARPGGDSLPPGAARWGPGAADPAGQALVAPDGAGRWSGFAPADAGGAAEPYAIEIRYRPWSAAGQAQAIEGAASAPAPRRGAEQDTVSSLQQAHRLRPRATLASGAGGVPGVGRGGTPAPGVPAAGGRGGPGFRSGPLGRFAGPYRGSPAADAGRRSYLRGVAARVHPLWAGAFPRAAALEGRQGMVIVGFTIAVDGSVAGAWVSRPSGVAAFDENCRRAVLRAAPFGPLPPELRPQLQVSLPFEFKNPAVQPPEQGDSG